MKEKKLSFHKLPLENKDLLKVWINKMKRDERFFNNVNKLINTQEFAVNIFCRVTLCLMLKKEGGKKMQFRQFFSWTAKTPSVSEGEFQEGRSAIKS